MDYLIKYCNPHILGNKLKYLTNYKNELVIIKARNNKEAEKKARYRLQTTGMLFEVEQRAKVSA